MTAAALRPLRAIALAAALAGSVTLGGCATFRGDSQVAMQPGSELVGRTMRLEAANGAVSTLTFRRDGTVRARFAQGSVDGRWWVENRQLCFLWGNAPRECWPYRRPFEQGRTVSLTSDRGNAVRVTLQ